jgi:ABC-type amino acid transport substrate-binding protein
MTTVGYGDRSPKTLMGRVIAGGWMLVAIIMTSSLTAGIATALTLVGLDQAAITRAGELDGKRVAVVKGTLSESFPSQYGATAISATDLKGAVQLLTSGDVDALVFDRPALEYYASAHPDTKLEISPRRYRPQGYGFAVAKDSDILHAMNVHLLHMKEEGSLPTSGGGTP